MSNFYTMQKMLAVTPIARRGVKPTIQGGIAIMSQSVETVTTELVFDAMIDNEILLKGSKIVFMGDSEAKQWNGKKLSHNGVEFVLAPMTDVLMVAPPEGADQQ